VVPEGGLGQVVVVGGAALRQELEEKRLKEPVFSGLLMHKIAPVVEPCDGG
jgi:hypothetical protein